MANYKFLRINPEKTYEYLIADLAKEGLTSDIIYVLDFLKKHSMNPASLMKILLYLRKLCEDKQIQFVIINLETQIWESFHISMSHYKTVSDGFKGMIPILNEYAECIDIVTSEQGNKEDSKRDYIEKSLLQAEIENEVKKTELLPNLHIKLPSGKHVDKFITTEKLLLTYEFIEIIGKAFFSAFKDQINDFVHREKDKEESKPLIIVGYGIPGERLAGELERILGSYQIDSTVVMFKGYYEPRPYAPIPSFDCRTVLILLPFLSSGTSLKGIVDYIEHDGGEVVGIGALLDGCYYDGELRDRIKSLCRFKINYYDNSQINPCPLCNQGDPCYPIHLDTFHPIIPPEKVEEVSLREKLKEPGRADILEFWNMAEAVGALHKDHEYRDGKHYFMYIDTDAILQNSSYRENIIQKMAKWIAYRYQGRKELPFILHPPNKRARVITQNIQAALLSWIPQKCPVFTAVEYGNDQYKIFEGQTNGYHEEIKGKDVVIVDDGVGTGRTLKAMYQLAKKEDAGNVCAAVLIDRLLDQDREEIMQYFRDNYYAVYTVPIPTYSVKGKESLDCPVCKEMRSLEAIIMQTEDEVQQYCMKKARHLRDDLTDEQISHRRNTALISKRAFQEFGSIYRRALFIHLKGIVSPKLPIEELREDDFPREAKADIIEYLSDNEIVALQKVLLTQLEKSINLALTHSILKALGRVGYTTLALPYLHENIDKSTYLLLGYLFYQLHWKDKKSQELMFKYLNRLKRDKIRQGRQREADLLGSIIQERRLVAISETMQELLKNAEKIVRKTEDATVLLLGESGTGKGMVAREIHRMSNRKERPFIEANILGVPETLVDDRLFGHTKGAFAGADSEQTGPFELADKGTVFIDEVGDVPITIQAKLLRVIQEKEVQRVGEQKVRKVDVRVIAATNKNLEQEVLEKRFREDLYYRINAFPLHLPPLRERKEDIVPLVDHFLNRYSRGEKGKLSSKAVELLNKYHWPGNVRELENAIQRAIVFADDDIPIILPDHLPSKIFEGLASKEESEKYRIENALKETNWNISKAARKLGIKSRGTLYEKIKHYNFKNPRAK